MAFLAHPGMAWPLEYPPAAILPMLPAAVPLVFALAMAAVGAVLYGVLRSSDPPAARTWILGCALGEIFIIAARFDLVPSLLAVLALLAAERGRWARAWGGPQPQRPCSGLVRCLARCGWSWSGARPDGGAATERRRPEALCWRLMGWPLSARAPTPSAASCGTCIVRWRSSRWPPAYALGSGNVLWPQMPEVRLALAVAQIGGQALLWLLYAEGRCTLRNAATLNVTWLVLVGTVFSPQYLPWMLPLWALADWRPRWLLLLVCVLTTVDYPFAFAVLHTESGVRLPRPRATARCWR